MTANVELLDLFNHPTQVRLQLTINKPELEKQSEEQSRPTSADAVETEPEVSQSEKNVE